MIDPSLVHPTYSALAKRWQLAYDFWRGGLHVLQPGYKQQHGWLGYFSGHDYVDASTAGTGWEIAREGSRYEWGPESAYNSYIWKHESESAEEFKERTARSWHLPVFAPIVNEIAASILRTPPDRENAGDPWKSFWQDVDESGINIDPFIRRCVSLGFVFGRIHVLIDRTKPATPATSLLEQKLRNERAYCQIITPFDLINWRVDEYGKFDWAIVREGVPDIRNPGEQWPDGVHPYQYRIWDKEACVLYRKRSNIKPGDSEQYEIVETSFHDLGFVPIESLFLTRNAGPKAMNCESAFASLVDLDRYVLNELSEAWNVERLQSFSLLAIPEEEGSSGGAIDVGAARAFGYPAGLSAPVYVSPDSSLSAGRWERLKDKILTARIAAGIGRGEAERSIERRSAEAIVEEMQAQLSQMSEWASAIQEFDNAVHKMVAKQEQQNIAPKASYRKSFYRTALLAAINVVNQLNSLQIVPRTVIGTMVKPLITHYLSELGIEQGEIDKAKAQIDEAIVETVYSPITMVSDNETIFNSSDDGQDRLPNGKRGNVDNSLFKK